MERARRVIPCLDTHGGKVVKGVQFEHLRTIGDPVELAQYYEAAGADELVVLDISATIEERKSALDLIAGIARAVSIPLAFGGGIRSVETARDAINAGAAKIAVNSAAVADPALIDRLVAEFGSERVVIAVDARRHGEGWTVVTHAGKKETGRDVIEWCKEIERRGAGEILLTSIDRDGTLDGYDLDLLKAVTAGIRIPVIASGGAGSTDHLLAGLAAGADGVLAASIFHERRVTIPAVKRAIERAGFSVRKPPSPVAWLDDVRWQENGLVPVIVEARDGTRMLGYADREALRRTVESGELWLYSRSRQQLWLKGEQSGNRHRVAAIDLDCDADAVRIRVEPLGPTCHTGATSCFFDRVWQPEPVQEDAATTSGQAYLFPEFEHSLPAIIERLSATIEQRLRDRPEGSYVVRLADDVELARRKVGEEALEMIMASYALRDAGGKDAQASPDARSAFVHEAADLLFHWLVLVRACGVKPSAIAQTLAERAR